MRYVTLPDVDDSGQPLVERWPSAVSDEVAPAVNEWVDEIAPVMIPEVVTVTRRTTHPDGTVVEETYQTQTGNTIPDPSGKTEPTGQQIERLADPGGELRVYTAGGRLLKEYAVGEWKTCSADPPDWLSAAGGDS